MIGWSFVSKEFKSHKNKTLPKVSFKSKSRKGFRYWILSSLLSISRTQLLHMIDSFMEEKPLIIDVGCNIGYVTRPLSLRTKTIGLDIDKDKVRWAKYFNKNVDFICCDSHQLPLRTSSVDIVVGASVLEHIENLPKLFKEIKLVLRKQGKFLVGYPIETRLIEVIFQSFWKSESPVWSQSKVMKTESYIKDPQVHKQNFSAIRKMLEKDFSLLKRQKIPHTYFPDFLCIYENILLLKNEIQ